MSILFAFIALGVLVTVHELGHFLAAKACGVYVEKFSIGFGPKLVSKKINDTEYMISLVPLGGYVKLYKMFKDEPTNTEISESKAFYLQNTIKKIFVITAGVLANFLFALFLFFIIALMGYRDYSPVIGKIQTDSIFQKFDMKEGDKVLEVNSVSSSSWSDLIKKLYDAKDEEKNLSVDRDGKIITITIPQDVQFEENDLFTISPYLLPIIGGISKSSPAQIAGLKKGDLIVSIDGVPLNRWDDIVPLVQKSKNSARIVVDRDDETMVFDVFPIEKETKDGVRKILGVHPIDGDVLIKHGLLESMSNSISNVYDTTIMIYKGLGMIVSGKVSRDSVGGPIQVVQQISSSYESGLYTYLMFIALFSVNLAVLNILPIPILDGGYLLLYLIEGITKRRLSVKARGVLQRVGVSFFLLLMTFVVINDLLRIFNK